MYRKITGFKGEHRFFGHPNGRIYVVDDSGAFPDTCDDGPVFIDTSRAIQPYRSRSGVTGIMFPVVVERGNRMSNAIAVGEEADYVRGIFGVRAKVTS